MKKKKPKQNNYLPHRQMIDKNILIIDKCNKQNKQTQQVDYLRAFFLVNVFFSKTVGFRKAKNKKAMFLCPTTV